MDSSSAPLGCQVRKQPKTHQRPFLSHWRHKAVDGFHERSLRTGAARKKTSDASPERNIGGAKRIRQASFLGRKVVAAMAMSLRGIGCVNAEINFCNSHRDDVRRGISAGLLARPPEDRFHDQELCLQQRVLFSGRRHLPRRRSRAPMQQCQLGPHSGSRSLHGGTAYTTPTPCTNPAVTMR